MKFYWNHLVNSDIWSGFDSYFYGVYVWGLAFGVTAYRQSPMNIWGDND